jgi:hypothetical protein
VFGSDKTTYLTCALKMVNYKRHAQFKRLRSVFYKTLTDLSRLNAVLFQHGKYAESKNDYQFNSIPAN